MISILETPMLLVKMKKSLLFCCFILLSQSTLWSQRTKGGDGLAAVVKTLPSFEINDNFIDAKNRYILKKDAARIAVRLLNTAQRDMDQTVEIPESVLKPIYNSLVAVSASKIEQADTTINILKIRTFTSTNVNMVMLVFDLDADWIKPLKAHADTTGSPVINKIMKRYKLSVNKIASLDDEHNGLVLQAKDPININALMRLFYQEAGVACIDPIPLFGDGNDIEMKAENKTFTVVFSLRYGKCTEKCDRRRDWTFKVSEGGQVNFVGVKGAGIPDYILKPAVEKSVKLKIDNKNNPNNKSDVQEATKKENG